MAFILKSNIIPLTLLIITFGSSCFSWWLLGQLRIEESKKDAIETLYENLLKRYLENRTRTLSTYKPKKNSPECLYHGDQVTSINEALNDWSEHPL